MLRKLLVSLFVFTVAPAAAKEAWIYKGPSRDVGASLRYVSLDIDGSITGRVNGEYDEKIGFYCTPRSDRIQMTVGFLGDDIVNKPSLRAKLSLGNASLDVTGTPIPGNDEAPKFTGVISGVGIIEEFAYSQQLEILVGATRVRALLATMGEKAAAFAKVCSRAAAAGAVDSPFVGKWAQLRSSAGNCPTCTVTVAPNGDGLTIASSNGWTAFLRGTQNSVAGEGEWPISGGWGGPIRVQLDWQGGEMRLAMTALRSGASLTAAFAPAGR